MSRTALTLRNCVRCSGSIDISQYVSASMVENPWAALEKQHQRQKAPPTAAKPPPSIAAAGPSIADALAGAVQVRCLMQHAFALCNKCRPVTVHLSAVPTVIILSCRMRKVHQLTRARMTGHGFDSTPQTLAMQSLVHVWLLWVATSSSHNSGVLLQDPSSQPHASKNCSRSDLIALSLASVVTLTP